MEFSDLKYLQRNWGVAPSPLNGKSSCPKIVSGNGGNLPPP